MRRNRIMTTLYFAVRMLEEELQMSPEDIQAELEISPEEYEDIIYGDSKDVVYIQKSYNDDETYDTEEVHTFKNEYDALQYNKKRVEQYFGFEWDKLPEEVEEFNELSFNRVVYDTGKGYQFFVVEKQEVH